MICSSFVLGFGDRLLPLALMVSVLAGAAPALVWAQGTSVEELERRLQKAKEERAQRDSAAAKARDAAESDRKRREAEESRAAADRKAQEARLAVLVVQADAPCILSINGKEVARLSKGIAELKVAPGQSLVSCVSPEPGGVTFEGELDARSGQNAVVRISMAQLADEQRARREEADRQQRQRRAEADRQERQRRAEAEKARQVAEVREACQRGVTHHLEDSGTTGVLRQTCTGMEWVIVNLGEDLDWPKARSACQSRGGGWDLPTIKELRSLYDESLPATPCGASGCKISGLLRLRSWAFWTSLLTSEPYSEYSNAWTVALNDGLPDAFAVRFKLDRKDILCARSN